MNSELERIPENVDPNTMGFHGINQWSLFASSLRNLFNKQGILQTYKTEFEIHNIQGTSPDRPLQVAIIEDMALKLHHTINSALKHKHPFEKKIFLTFIGMLVTTSLMTKGDEEFVAGWVKKRSKLKMICEAMLDKIKILFGHASFPALKKDAVDFLVKNKDTIFNEEYKNEIFKKITMSAQHPSLTWNKILSTISTLNMSIESENNNQALIITNAETMSNKNQKNHYKKISSNLSRDFQSTLDILIKLQSGSISGKKLYVKLTEIQSDVELLCQRFHNHISIREVPSREDRIIAKYILLLNLEMIKCYNLVTAWAIKNLFFNRAKLITALQIQMHCYSKVLYYAFEQHTEVHKGIWFGFNQCYLMAFLHKVHTKPLKKPQNWHNQINTLEDMYKHALLMSLINPYQLHAEELKSLNYALEHWASLVVLTNEENAFITIDLDADDPPEFFQKYKNYSHSSYKIKLKKVVDRIQKLIVCKQNNNCDQFDFVETEINLSAQILESILNNWNISEISKLANQQINTSFLTRVYLGMPSSIYLINHEHSINNHNNTDTPIQEIQQHEHIEEINLDSSALASQHDRNTMFHQSHICEIIEKNANQYVLKWNDDIPKELRCGELIAIEDYDMHNEKKWELGTIKSIKNEINNTQVFVTILSTDIIVVQCYYSDSVEPSKSLLMSALPTDCKDTSIFAPAFPLKEGQEINITVEGKSYSAYLEEVVSESAYYKQFNAHISDLS